MTALKLALSFIRIPRLFISLFLFPILISLIIVILQYFTSAIFLTQQQHSENSSNIEKTPQTYDIMRSILIGEDKLNNLQLCIWDSADPSKPLIPPSSSCELQRYDVVITPQVIKIYGLEVYQKLFTHQFPTIHICDGCLTDIVIWNNNGKPQIEFRSFFALSLFRTVHITEDFKLNYTKALKSLENLDEKIGEKYLILSGFTNPTKIKDLTTTFVLVVNICMLIITALWLSIKAHRKILDYFSQSGSLLPLVAANGKTTFYSALWILTSMRVIAFLLATIPMGYWVFSGILDEKISKLLFAQSKLTLIFWILNLVITLSLAALIASIAELKARHTLLSFKYKLAPIILCIIGGIVWSATFFFETGSISLVRHIISLIPLVGISPILLAPIFIPPILVLILNTIFSAILIVVAIKKNAHWFAAHLDEI
jgi:hypothetical protein